MEITMPVRYETILSTWPHAACVYLYIIYPNLAASLPFASHTRTPAPLIESAPRSLFNVLARKAERRCYIFRPDESKSTEMNQQMSCFFLNIYNIFA